MKANELPRIICHMMTALDGRIIGPFMDTDAAEVACEEQLDCRMATIFGE